MLENVEILHSILGEFLKVKEVDVSTPSILEAIGKSDLREEDRFDLDCARRLINVADNDLAEICLCAAVIGARLGQRKGAKNAKSLQKIERLIQMRIISRLPRKLTQHQKWIEEANVFIKDEVARKRKAPPMARVAEEVCRKIGLPETRKRTVMNFLYEARKMNQIP